MLAAFSFIPCVATILLSKWTRNTQGAVYGVTK